MVLYLVQHGEAMSEEADPSRPLSVRGREEVVRVAGAAARAGISVRGIYHSGKLRARQTAECLAQALVPSHQPSQVDGLAPMDDPAVARQALADLETPAMLVGHLPHLSRLSSLLLTGNAGAEVVQFRMGGIVCLASAEEGRWQVQWMLTPELIV